MPKEKEFKYTEAGKIPFDWNVSNIFDLSNGRMQNGLFFKPSLKGRGAKIINVRDLYEKFPIDIDALELFEAREDELQRFKVDSGDIFFTRSSIVPNGIAQCNIYLSSVQRPVVFDSHVIRVRPDNKKVSPHFLFRYCISSNARNYFVAHSKTATMTTIDQNILGKCPIALPPTLAEQQAIAEALSDTDTLIESLEQLITKKRQIKKGAMQELLTGNQRLAGFSGEWKITSMREILKQSATYGIVKAGFFVQDGIKMIRGGDIYNGKVNINLPMVTKEKADEYSRTSLQKDDVVIALVGYPGETAKIPDSLIEANISRAVGLLRLSGKVTPDFLVCLLNSPFGRKMVLAPSAGSAQQVVNLSALNKLEFTYPPLPEQTAIATILSDMDAEITALEQKLSKARQIKQGMMQELLTGRIRLV